VLLCGAAQAQPFEIGVLGGYPRMTHAPLGSISPESPQDGDTTLKGDYSQGAWFTINTKGYYGHELTYLLSRATLRTTVRTDVNGTTVVTTQEDRIAVHMAAYNFLIYFMPRGERWRPYVTGGLQAYEYQKPHIPDWPSGHTRHYGFNYGGGIKLVPFKHTVVRFDFRDYLGGKPYQLTFANEGNSGGLVHQLEGTVGFGISF
jgi:hypothetical protein